ncbi:DUF11 domain-containing protein [Spirosoma foliorum]|uniref:DUF11 domain-containing protein n=1 Tax=Spirosoma foliorum TaxID=2710596 RepID=A0A7G5GX86_9BACT|nr:DUF11 domain-containing protein [Spirosoma foliorum]QMW03478.1 DUF11 domain-containing protein [Spirosoma foliorum]
MPISTCCRLLVGLLFIFQSSLVYSQNQPSPSERDTLRRIAEEEQRRLIDPATGTVPYERLDEARRKLNNQSSTANGGPSAQSGIPGITWQERGPSNAGGRTRALLFDLNDPAHKKVWAGSPAGGLWYTNDISDASATWTSVSDTWENTVVTALAADPSNPQVMYAGTGDGYNYVTGGGIWKTTNGGTTWSRLTSTIPSGNSPSINYSFGYIQQIIVNGSGQVFVATRSGIVRSVDGGTSWTYALAPNQGIGAGSNTNNYYNDFVTDLELATDGILYAAFNPSRIFKSTSSSGTAWSEITPTGITGERTELALAPSTNGANQVIYAVSRAYNNVNYGQDVKWFKKSSNGGTSWTDVPIPTFSWNDHFTSGNGYYALNLAVHPTDANTIYAGGYDWLRSIDGGTTWSGALANRYINQQGLWFQPGSNINAIFADDKGIRWSTDWGNNAVSAPTFVNRNTGYRVAEISSVSMKASAGSSYLLAGARGSGYFQQTTAGLSTGTMIWSTNYSTGITFIDDNEPDIQIFQSYGQFYRYDGANFSQLVSLNSYSYPNPSDYDSQSNTLYTTDFTNNQAVIRKVVGIGGSPSTTTLTLSGLTNSLTYLKLNTDRTALFAGSYSGKLYKITNLNQSTPTVTAIDNGVFSQYATLSGIDVGATDNELLVTLSNYGVQSVWYTNDGGNTWTGKDQSNYGLPDVPVRTALFNPQNRKQVLLGTDVGIWSTTDITASNPGWTFSSSGLGTLQVNQLRYRASDGRLSAATNGRGIFSSDAFAIPYILPSVAITNISNANLCAGNTFTVSFSTTGPAFSTGNKFEVWLSDATGNFANPTKIGSNATSPISATLPSGYSAMPYGTTYRVKIIATNPDVESSLSGVLAIGNLGSISVYDHLADFQGYYSGGTICIGGKTTLKAYTYTTNYSSTTPASYQWLFNGSSISGATSATVSAQQAGTYVATVQQAGCTITSKAYTLTTSSNPYVSFSSLSNGEPQCDDHPLKLFSNYIGETASYQWARDGIDIAGATSYTYTASQTGKYSLRMTDGSCYYSVSPSYIQFGRSLYARASLNTIGDSLLCSASPNYSISMYASIPSSNDYTVQWYRNGLIVPGATSMYYYATQPGAYSFLLKQGTCQTFSNAVSVRMVDQFQASINYSFASKSACPGEVRNLYTSIYNNSSYQWQKDGVDIAGATSSNYGATSSGSYTLKLTRGSCSAISAPVSLTFSNAIVPKVIYYSSTAEGCSGKDIYAWDSYNLSGYQFQWYKNGVVINNASSDYFYATQSGAYSVRVTNGSCTGLSKEIYVDAGNGNIAKPVITTSPVTSQLCMNNTLRLSINSYNGTVQWKRNGVAIAGATSYQFYATESGLYTVFNQDGSCTAESDPVDIRIGEPTTATISGLAIVNSGQSTLLPVSFTGPAPWSFTLTNGQSVTATYQNPAFIAVSPTSNTIYQLASVGNACGTGTVSGQASVSVGTSSADVSLNMAVSNRVPNVGDVVSYTLSAANAGPQDAVGVQLSSLLPAGLAFVNSSSPGLSAVNGVVSASLGTIPANGVSSVSFQVTPTQAGIFATSAQIIASQTPDPDSQPGSGTGDGQDDEVTVDLRTPNGGSLVTSANPNQMLLPVVLGNQPATDPNKIDLSLGMWVDKLTPAASDIISTSLTVNNRGGSSASSIIVQVVLPNGSFNAQSPAGWIQVDSQTYKRYINALAAGQSATVSLKWQPSGSGTLKAQILDAAETDSDSTPGNGYANGEDDEAAVTVRAQ